MLKTTLITAALLASAPAIAGSPYWCPPVGGNLCVDVRTVECSGHMCTYRVTSDVGDGMAFVDCDQYLAVTCTKTVCSEPAPFPDSSVAGTVCGAAKQGEDE